ncbi:MAG: hypothetical protein ABGZ35_06145 [Planctomycetaceae bacterium]
MLDLQLGSDDSEELRRQFRSRFSRQEIASEAEACLKQQIASGGSCFTFTHLVGGLVGYTIRRLLVQVIEPRLISGELVLELLSDYAFSLDWVPPRLLIRETLAHAVHIRRLVEQLRSEFDVAADAPVVIEHAATQLASTESAFQLSDDQVDKVIDALLA